MNIILNIAIPLVTLSLIFALSFSACEDDKSGPSIEDRQEVIEQIDEQIAYYNNDNLIGFRTLAVTNLVGAYIEFLDTGELVHVDIKGKREIICKDERLVEMFKHLGDLR